MDLMQIESIFKEEAKRLNISLPCRIVLFVQSTHSNVEGNRPVPLWDDIMCEVSDKTIELRINCEREFSEKEFRLLVRHDLCHVVNFLNGKIDHGFELPPDMSDNDPLRFLLCHVRAVIQGAFYEYLIAKSYIRLFGADECRTQSEIGMDDFLESAGMTITDAMNKILNTHSSNKHLQGYVIIDEIFALLYQAIRVSFYNSSDPRFPQGIWDIVRWLQADFDNLDALEITWRDKASLLTLETALLVCVVDFYSVLNQPLSRREKMPCFGAYRKKLKHVSYAETLFKIWQRRFKALSIRGSSRRLV